MARYYVHENGQTLGPFEAADVVKRPGFNPALPACQVGATSADAWRPAAQFPEIAAAMGSAPPPPPPPPPAPASTQPVSGSRTELTLALPPGMELERKSRDESLPDPSTKLVLIIDDEETVRDLLEARIQMAGFRTITAVNGKDAKAKMDRQLPDLIVTDMMMPGEGGYEFLKTIENPEARRLPVFIVTGAPLDDSTIEMIKAEANVARFVRKPIEFDLFVEGLHKALKTKPRDPGWKG